MNLSMPLKKIEENTFQHSFGFNMSSHCLDLCGVVSSNKPDEFSKAINFLNQIKDYVDSVTPGYGCAIFKGSELFTDYKKFGVTFKENGWYSLSTTPGIKVS